MRAPAALLLLNLLGCAVDAEPPPPRSTQAVTSPPATDAITWDPSRNGIDDIWPAGAGVFATTVTIQPDAAAGDGSMLATVMWNGDFLGEVYRLRASDDGAFRAIVTASHAVLTAPRTERAVSDDGGATTDTGGGSGGRIIPTPHPNV